MPTVELGKKYDRLGAHMTLEVKHKSSLKLNYAKIRKYFQDNLTDGKKINLFCKHYYKNPVPLTDEQKIKQYVKKTFGDEYQYRVGKFDYEIED